MSRYPRCVGGESFSVHTHSDEVLHVVLSSLWRRKVLIATVVATALALGIIAALLMGQRYTAEAFIRGVLFNDANDAEGKSAALIPLDLGRMIVTQSTLLQSHQLARQVVERVGLKKLRPEVGEGSWLESYVQPADSPARAEELAATRLLDRLSVTTDGRAYLIAVRYTEARDRELATLITNAFVAEILRKSQLQILSQQRSSTQASLSKRLAKFGEKYPRVIEAKLQLVAIDDLLEKWQRKTHDEILRASGENVTLAIAFPSNIRRLVVSLLVLLGVLVGIGVALWLERDNWWKAPSHYYAGILDATSVSHAAKILVAARLAKNDRTKLLAVSAEDT